MRSNEGFCDAQSLSRGKKKPLPENARQAKSQLIAHLSHELRTRLNTILGFAQLLERCSDDTTLGDERESIESILTAGRCMQCGIDSLLDLATIEIVDHEDAQTDRRPS